MSDGDHKKTDNRLHPVVMWSSPCVPILLLVVLCWAWTYDEPDTTAPKSGPAFVRHFIHYGLFHGYGAGFPEKEFILPVPVGLLEPGDIIVCGNPGAVYGRWSHATIYLGNGQVLAQDLLRGIGIEQVAELSWYDHLRVLRPSVPLSVRIEAAQHARKQIGVVFNVMAHPRDPWQLTCSRGVDAAYQAVGVTIIDERFWITPDSLAEGKSTIVVDR